MREELQDATGVAPAFAIESFTDLDADVRQSILRVRRSEFLLHRELIRGFVHDVDTHRLREVVVDARALRMPARPRAEGRTPLPCQPHGQGCAGMTFLADSRVAP